MSSPRQIKDNGTNMQSKISVTLECVGGWVVVVDGVPEVVHIMVVDGVSEAVHVVFVDGKTEVVEVDVLEFAWVVSQDPLVAVFSYSVVAMVQSSLVKLKGTVVEMAEKVLSNC